MRASVTAGCPGTGVPACHACLRQCGRQERGRAVRAVCIQPQTDHAIDAVTQVPRSAKLGRDRARLMGKVRGGASADVTNTHPASRIMCVSCALIAPAAHHLGCAAGCMLLCAGFWVCCRVHAFGCAAGCMLLCAGFSSCEQPHRRHVRYTSSTHMSLYALRGHEPHICTHALTLLTCTCAHTRINPPARLRARTHTHTRTHTHIHTRVGIGTRC